MVSVCTPPSLHLEQCLALLESGKHVVCEKPLVGSLAAVDELTAAQTAAGRWRMPSTSTASATGCSGSGV